MLILRTKIENFMGRVGWSTRNATATATGHRDNQSPYVEVTPRGTNTQTAGYTGKAGSAGRNCDKANESPSNGTKNVTTVVNNGINTFRGQQGHPQIDTIASYSKGSSEVDEEITSGNFFGYG